EVAEEALVRVTGRDGLYQQVAADEAALPGRAAAAERLLAVTARAGLVDAHLERLQVDRQLGGHLLVVARQAGHQRAVGRVHRREQLVLGVDDGDRVDRSERLGVHQAGPAGRREEHGRGHVRAGVLAGQERRAVERAPIQRYRTVPDRLVHLAP